MAVEEPPPQVSPPAAASPDPSWSLRTWERAVAAALGIGFGVAGTVAVFRTSNGAGTAALLVIAAVFLLVAVAGLVPQRLKAGEQEVEFGRAAAQTVKQLVQAAPPEAREELIAILAKQLGEQTSRVTSLAEEAAKGRALAAAVQASLEEIEVEPDRGPGRL